MDTETGEKLWTMAVKAVITDADGRQLLVRRSAHCRNFVGVWEWPGGKLDPGEDFATALLREAREETGLEVQITGLAGTMTYEMSAAHIVLLCMETRRVSGEPRLSEEHDDFAWVSLSEMQGLHLLPDVGDFMLEYGIRKGMES